MSQSTIAKRKELEVLDSDCEEFSLSEYGVNMKEYDREDESDRDFDLLEISRGCLENGNGTGDDSHQNLGGSGDFGGSLDLKSAQIPVWEMEATRTQALI